MTVVRPGPRSVSRDGEVAQTVVLDENSRRVANQLPDQVPTIGALLEELARARRDDTDTAEATYTDDGHPVRISLDRDKNAIDDEAVYDIRGYAPAADPPAGPVAVRPYAVAPFPGDPVTGASASP